MKAAAAAADEAASSRRYCRYTVSFFALLRLRFRRQMAASFFAVFSSSMFSS